MSEEKREPTTVIYNYGHVNPSDIADAGVSRVTQQRKLGAVFSAVGDALLALADHGIAVADEDKPAAADALNRMKVAASEIGLAAATLTGPMPQGKGAA